jgi:hypothetical protein
MNGVPMGELKGNTEFFRDLYFSEQEILALYAGNTASLALVFMRLRSFRHM